MSVGRKVLSDEPTSGWKFFYPALPLPDDITNICPHHRIIITLNFNWRRKDKKTLKQLLCLMLSSAATIFVAECEHISNQLTLHSFCTHGSVLLCHWSPLLYLIPSSSQPEERHSKGLEIKWFDKWVQIAPHYGNPNPLIYLKLCWEYVLESDGG